jgi:hypothetical protein
VLYAPIDTASMGDNTIVAAVTGRRIRVVSYVLVAAGAVTAQWKDSAAATVKLAGAMSLITGVPVEAQPMPEGRGAQYGHFETSAGNALVLNLGGNVQVSGHVSYVVAN